MTFSHEILAFSHQIRVFLPELMLTTAMGLQVHFFKEHGKAIERNHQEHMELQIHLARNHPTFEDLARELKKLEENFRDKKEPPRQ